LKKIFVVFLALVYFVAGSGLLLRQHYCGGDYVGTQIDLSSLNDTEMCISCGMEEEEQGGCCENKVSLIKKTVEHQLFSFQVWDFTAVLFDIAPNIVSPIASLRRMFCIKVLLTLQKPPPKPIALYKEIACFRI
jgi:hypothetical protein